VRDADPDRIGREVTTGGDADVRSQTGCTVVGVGRDGTVVADVGPGFRGQAGDELIVVGTDEGTDTNSQASRRRSGDEMPLTGDSTILVPVDVSVADHHNQVILDLLRPVNLVVLGYYPVPKQTAPAHLKEDHEAEAAERLSRIAERFAGGGHEVEDVLVFTKDRQDTIDRIADQYDCDAVFVPGDAAAIDRILVPLRGDANLDRIVSLVADLLRASDAAVTLFHSVPEGTDPSQGEFVLRGAVDRLSEDGIDRDRIEWTLSEHDAPKREIVDLAAEHDLVILGETKPSLADRILGAVLRPILDEIAVPAIVVRDVA